MNIKKVRIRIVGDGGTYITLDNFLARKIQSQNSVALHSFQLIGIFHDLIDWFNTTESKILQ